MRALNRRVLALETATAGRFGGVLTYDSLTATQRMRCAVRLGLGLVATSWCPKCRRLRCGARWPKPSNASGPASHLTDSALTYRYTKSSSSSSGFAASEHAVRI